MLSPCPSPQPHARTRTGVRSLRALQAHRGWLCPTQQHLNFLRATRTPAGGPPSPVVAMLTVSASRGSSLRSGSRASQHVLIPTRVDVQELRRTRPRKCDR